VGLGCHSSAALIGGNPRIGCAHSNDKEEVGYPAYRVDTIHHNLFRVAACDVGHQPDEQDKDVEESRFDDHCDDRLKRRCPRGARDN